jgi:hypothetical protein
MHADVVAARMLSQEARALLARLALVKSFALQQTSVPAAAVSPEAQTAIERHLGRGRSEMKRRVASYLRWLEGNKTHVTAAEMQRRFAVLRLSFNVVLSQLDIFSAALTQRSERETGVWLGGLDAVANDALRIPGGYYAAPPVICYLDRGMGAAIRRARTRMPGGGTNPVAIIKVPRERMVGSGIGASLIHEVGHQAAALLDLVPSLQSALQATTPRDPGEQSAWALWERWISEIVADFWAIAHLGVGATVGLMSVVCLPRAFVFRLNVDDPHPIPWVRVKLSCALGRSLFPHPQWDRLERLWEALYPSDGVAPAVRAHLAALEATMPRFVRVLTEHAPWSLRGRLLVDVLPVAQRQPRMLAAHLREWKSAPARMKAARPALALAVLGQAKVDGAIAPEAESRAVDRLLTDWALASALESAAQCTERAEMNRVMSA